MTKRHITRKSNKSRISPQLREWLRATFVALVLLIFMRFFVFDLVSISDSSMERSLLSGDVVLVKKYNYGTRMPLRILPHSWVSVFFSTDTLPPEKQLPYWRLPGNRELQHNDLIYFNTPALLQQPIDQRLRRIKRIVAMPGEELQIKNGVIWVQGVAKPNPVNAQMDYQVQTRKGVVDEDFLALLELSEGRKTSGRNRYIFPLTAQMADSVFSMPGVLRVEEVISNNFSDIHPPYGKGAINWTPDNFGSLRVPSKGMTITLSPENIDKYGYHILFHERRDLQQRNDSVFINSRFVTEYTFRMNYYFVLGDNRHNTSDSRMWGMVPESHIIGRASDVFFSFDKKDHFIPWPRWSRWFSDVANL